MSGKNAVGFGPCVLLALLASPPASAGVVNGVLSQWNLQAKECKDGQIDLTELALDEEAIRNVHRLYINGCGSAYHVGMAARWIAEGRMDRAKAN